MGLVLPSLPSERNHITSQDGPYLATLPPLSDTAAVKFEMASIDARQNRETQPGAAAGLESSSRPAPFASRVAIDPWITGEFAVAIESPRSIERESSELIAP